MLPNISSKDKKILIIPDVHQAFGWVKDILAKENDADHIIFLGDYFDCFEFPDGKKYYTVEQSLNTINVLSKQGNITWLLGNHDISYIASHKPRSYNNKGNEAFLCSGWTKNKQKMFNAYADPEWIKQIQLFAVVDDDLVFSHAGLHPSHILPHHAPIDAVRHLNEKWNKEKDTFKFDSNHWLMDVGRCRGGYSKYGSPIWLDWDDEFIPVEGIRQIVGHTNYELNYIKQNEYNFCIDRYRTTYMIIENGKFEFKNIL